MTSSHLQWSNYPNALSPLAAADDDDDDDDFKLVVFKIGNADFDLAAWAWVPFSISLATR